MQLAPPLDPPELFLDPLNALADQAAVDLKLTFAGTAEEAKAAALAFKVGPAFDQAAALIRQVGKLDLQRAFLGVGAPAENLEDQPGAVEHLGVPGFLQIALLDRRERAVRDHNSHI